MALNKSIAKIFALKQITNYLCRQQVNNNDLDIPCAVKNICIQNERFQIVPEHCTTIPTRPSFYLSLSTRAGYRFFPHPAICERFC